MDEHNNIRKSFWLTLLTVSLLLLLFFLPRIELFDKTLRRVNLLSDVMRKSSDGTILAEAALDSLQGYEDSLKVDAALESELASLAEAASDSVEERLVLIEDYAGGDSCEMDKFHQALTESSNRQVRIAFFGDSFIEGDILAGHLRHLLQSRYGGKGVGWVEVENVSDQFRATVRAKNDGWSIHTAVDNHDFIAGNQSFAGSYFLPDSIGHLTLRCQSAYYPEQLAKVDEATVFYQSNGSLELIAGMNGGSKETVEIEAIKELQTHIMSGNISSVDLEATGDGLVYGVALDGVNGIVLDNYCLRGSTGLHLSDVSESFATRFASERPYDLIMLEYGLNVASKKSTDYSGYIHSMTKVIRKLKAWFPGASILVLGASDRDEKGDDGQLHTMKGVESLIKFQRKLAHDSGVAFWDTRRAMGGEGAIAKFEEEGMAGKDYTHINAKGGDYLAELLFDALTSDVKKRKEK